MTRLEQLRFQRLTRHFVHNFFDNELLAPAGEASKVFVSLFALLGALGFTLALVFSLRYTYFMVKVPKEVRLWAAATDNLLVILMTMTVMGLLVVLAWDGLLPSRRDGHILGTLPVSAGEIFRARLLATVLLFCLALVAFSALPGVVLCAGQTRANDWEGFFRRFLAQYIAIFTAAGFVYFGAVTLQSLLMAVLPYARFLQVSGIVQVALLVSSFAVLFLTPGMDTASRLHWDWVVYLPPYWFYGLWQSMSGGLWIYGGGPPVAALAAFLTVVLSALTLSAVLHRSALRKAVEGLPLAPKGPGMLQRGIEQLLNALLLRDPRERAVFWFAVRTLTRQRSHRLMFAIYFGLGLAWVLAGLSSLLTTDATKAAIRPNAVLCTIPADLAAMLLIGMRVLFSLPVEVRANWLPRISVPESADFAVNASRKLMLLAAVLPMAILPLPLMAATWGPRAALVHLWFYLLVTLLLLELLMMRFHKFPFACSWLPGQANLKVKLGIYFLLFASASGFLGALESHVLLKNSRETLVNFSAFIGGWLAWLIYQRRRQAAERPALSFEERPDLGFNALQLE